MLQLAVSTSFNLGGSDYIICNKIYCIQIKFTMTCINKLQWQIWGEGRVCTSSLTRRRFTGWRKCLENLCRKTSENGMFTSCIIALRIYTYLSCRTSRMASCITCTASVEKPGNKRILSSPKTGESNRKCSFINSRLDVHL